MRGAVVSRRRTGKTWASMQSTLAQAIGAREMKVKAGAAAEEGWEQALIGLR